LFELSSNFYGLFLKNYSNTNLTCSEGAVEGDGETPAVLLLLPLLRWLFKGLLELSEPSVELLSLLPKQKNTVSQQLKTNHSKDIKRP
jgi:hypothetical protein